MGRVLQFPIVAAFLLTGWGPVGVQGQAGAGAAPPASESRLEPADFEALFHARADSSLQNFVEEDVHFFRMMIPHHSQALEMSALAANRTENRSILALAARISGGQAEEIDRMRAWLRLRGLAEPGDTSAPEPAAALPATMDGHDHGAAGAAPPVPEVHMMPGLLTSAEMAELAAAEGSEFDRLFLSYMIYHHRGAIQMVEELFASPNGGKDEEVFRFAAEIRVDQSTEVSRMERMLSLVGTTLGTP